MALVSASTLIQRAFNVCGIFSPGESIPPADAADAKDMLDMMTGSWALQPLTMPVVMREVFPLTDEVGVYTIGPGGTFDTTRPNQADLTGASVLLNNNATVKAVTSLTRVASVVTATVTSHGAATGQNVTIRGALPAAYNGTFPITVTGVNTFTYLFGGAATSPATGTMTAFVESNLATAVEMDVFIATDDMRQWRSIKSLTSPLVTSVYYNPTFSGGLGTIELWPIPTETTNALVLYRRQQLARFANLTTQYQLPDGLDEAIQYNLARRLLAPYGVKDPAIVGDIRELAGTSLGTFKRGNVKISDLPIGIGVTRHLYNILTDR